MSLPATDAFADQRRFVGVRQVAAGRDEKRAAAHRGIEDAQRQDLPPVSASSTSGASVRRTRYSVSERGV